MLSAILQQEGALSRTCADLRAACGPGGALHGVAMKLGCGGVAGCVARTTVAPIDRVKLLLQTQTVLHAEPAVAARGAPPPRYTGVWDAMRRVAAEEGGVHRLWRGNGVNCLKVAPHSALQFASYDAFKQGLLRRRRSGSGTAGDAGAKLGLGERLLCGSLAGMTAASVTHPLDLLRTRMAVTADGSFRRVLRAALAEGAGVGGLYRGMVSTYMSVTPYIAINFTCFDSLKQLHADAFPDAEPSPLPTLAIGACAGLLAQTVCYPLDTVRRRMQLSESAAHYRGAFHALRAIPQREGLRGLYKGMLPNALKLVPSNGIRFLVYDTLKQLVVAEEHARA